MPIYFAGLTYSTLFDHRMINELGEIAEFCQITHPALTDIEIGKEYLLLWESEKLLYSSRPSRHNGYAWMQVKLPTPAANENCKLVTPHYGELKISILTTNDVFWEYDIDENDWKQINIFTPKSSEHAVKIIHCGCNLLLTNLGRLLIMHNGGELEIEFDVKFIDMAYGGEDVILLGDDGNVYEILIEDGMPMDDVCAMEPIELTSPLLIPFEAKIVQIAAGEGHYAAITDQGHLYTWGNNPYGELGLRSCKNFQKIPQLVSFQNDNINIEVKVKKVGCGASFTICLTDDGTLWGVGYSIYYELQEDSGCNELLGTFIKLNMELLCGERVKDLKCNEWSIVIITE